MQNHPREIFKGTGNPCYIIAEVGINHNGSLDTAKRLIDVAVSARADCVKFQKRNPDVCVPEEQKSQMRQTPWGYIPYIDYRRIVEFDKPEYDDIDQYCFDRGIDWSASAWDTDSVDFLDQYHIPFIKIPSAKITDVEYLKRVKDTGKPIIASTGMADMDILRKLWEIIGGDETALLHCISTYPSNPAEINLNIIKALKTTFGCVVGYSGHERGIQSPLAAVAIGAKIIEKHITLDRSMWGTDQSASLEPDGLKRLVRDIRIIEFSMGDGIKRFLDSEREVARRLRG